LLKNVTRLQAVEVPYKGGVLAVQDLLGGQIQFIFSDSLPAMAHIRAGKLRALCITGAEPFALLPELPTCQAAAPGLVAVNWWGVLMPAGTPRAIVARFHGDTVKTLADPDVKKKFADLGVEAVSSTPELQGRPARAWRRRITRTWFRRPTSRRSTFPQRQRARTIRWRATSSPPASTCSSRSRSRSSLPRPMS